MTSFARRVLGLQEVFPSSGLGVAQPGEVSDTVSLVHRWPSAKAALDRIERVQFSSAPALTPDVTAFTVPQGRWSELLFGDLAHSSATNRIIQMVLTIANQNFFIGRWTGMASVLTVGQPSGFEPLVAGASSYSSALASDRILPPWPLVIPPGAALRFLGDTAAAPWAIDVGLVFISHPLAEDSVIGGG